MKHLAVSVAFLLLPCISKAQVLGRRLPDISFGTKSIYSCSSVQFSAADMPATLASGKCIIALGTQIPQTGSCIGNASDQANGQDFCTTVDFTSRTVDMSAAGAVSPRLCAKVSGSPCAVDGDCSAQSVTSVCFAGRCSPTVSGSECYHDGLNTKSLVTGDGTRPIVLSPLMSLGKLGGTGVDGAFDYAGEDTSTTSHKCAANGGNASTCRSGTCSGTWPNGTCTLTPNSLLSHAIGDSNNTLTAFVGNYTTFSLTGGTALTVTNNTNGMGTWLVIRALDAISISGGKFDLKGYGTTGATAATCNAQNQQGKPGGNSIWMGGAGGAAGANAGTAGTAAASDPLISLVPAPNFAGTGGGTSHNNGATAAFGSGNSPFGTGFGATGGGGGGCATACASGSTGAGGKGGGFLRLESLRSVSLTSTAVIDLRGNDGSANGGGGGGGGSLLIVAPSVNNVLTKDTSTCATTGLICVKGGAAGSTNANCGAPAAGGNGDIFTQTLP